MKYISIFLLLLAFSFLNAQPVERLVKVHVIPDHTDWTYKPGEKVNYTISITRNEELVPNSFIRYEIGPEKMPGKKDSINLVTGITKIDAGTMTGSSFQRIVVTTKVDGKESVSYTHLDVYKRQLYSSPVNTFSLHVSYL